MFYHIGSLHVSIRLIFAPDEETAISFIDNPQHIVFSGLKLDSTRALSIGGWIYVDSLASIHQTILREENGDFELSITPEGYLGWRHRMATPVESIGTVRVGEWQHIAVTIGEYEVKFYLDGILDASAKSKRFPALEEVTIFLGNSAQINDDLDFFGTPFRGAIDSLAIWKSQLDDEQMLGDAEGYTYQPSLVQYWDFSEPPSPDATLVSTCFGPCSQGYCLDRKCHCLTEGCVPPQPPPWYDIAFDSFGGSNSFSIGWN